MTARNAPPVRSSACNFEEQMILRVPLHIAEELRKMLRDVESDGPRGGEKKKVAQTISQETGLCSFCF